MNLKGKKILIQGAGRGHLGLIETCIRLGISTIVTGLKGDYPCIPLADKFVECDIKDKEGILKIAQQENVDGIIICCSDTGLESVGFVNDRLGLNGISEKSAQLCSDKLKMKEKLVGAGVRTPNYYPINKKSDLKGAILKLEFPLILKATNLQGSRGIFIVANEQEVNYAYDKIFEMTYNPNCVLEEYIIGKEFGVQAFVSRGNVLFVLPHGDETIRCETNVPVGHYMPYNMNESLIKDTEAQVKNAIAALGLNCCAVNVDLIEKNGKAYIIELTGRVGANCLPELTSNYFGIDYYEMILAELLEKDGYKIYKQAAEPTATKAQMIKSDFSGRVKSLRLPENKDGQITMFIHRGDEIRIFKNCNDAIGQIVVKGHDLSECDEKIRKILNNIYVELE